MLGPQEERAELMAPGAADFLLDVNTPPSPSYMVLPQRIAPDPRHVGFTMVTAICSDRLLVRATQGEGLLRAAYFLGDVHDRTFWRLPDAPREFRPDAGTSIGLIANPLRVDQYTVVQLHPVSPGRHETHKSIIICCTATRRWTVKELASAPELDGWRDRGVLAHKELLWWVDSSKGLLVCDPFLNRPSLRFVPLPDGCEKRGWDDDDDDGVRRLQLLDCRRILRPSDGKLRYVEVTTDVQDLDSAVRVWTLIDQEGPQPWMLQYSVTLVDIWGHHSYAAAGLPRGVVHDLAFVNPNNAGIIYFFHGTALFCVHLHDGSVTTEVGGEFIVDASKRLLSFQASRFVQAWVPGMLQRNVIPSEKEYRGRVIRFNGKNPLSHVRRLRQGNMVSPRSKSELLPEDSQTQRTLTAVAENLHTALGRLRLKLNNERSAAKRQKLIRERKYVYSEFKSE